MSLTTEKNAPGTGGIFDHEKSEVAHKVMDDTNRARREASISAYERQFQQQSSLSGDDVNKK